MSSPEPCCGDKPAHRRPIRIPLLGAATAADNCRPGPATDTFAYRDWPCHAGSVTTPVGAVPRVEPTVSWRDTFGRWAMRWGIGRDRYRVRPGLYALGAPDPAAPVLVGANYKLSFDVLRQAMTGRNAWLLVLDTKGINVWCAAGKGTFGTLELLRQLDATRLASVVNHRTLIVPQLGAVGVAAHEVTRLSGFRVIYGPVRATDLPAFLDAGQQATPAMRRVTFTTVERLILTPVELSAFGLKPLWIALGLFLLGGLGPGLFALSAAITRGGAAIGTGLAGLLTGAVLTPVLLPWLPGRAFAAKGALAGLAAAGAVLCVWSDRLDACDTVALLALIPASASYCAMNFTGSSTFTSPSGVEKEMRRYLPLQAAAALVAAISWLTGAFLT